MVYEVGLEKSTLCFVAFLGFICFGVSVYFSLYIKKHNLISFFSAFTAFMLFMVCSQALVTGAVFYNTPCFNISFENNSSMSTGFNCPVYYSDIGLGSLFFLLIILSSLMMLFSGLNILFGYGGYI